MSRCSHEAPRFFCPRKDNLTEHSKRVHGTDSHVSVATLKGTAQASRVVAREDEEMENSGPASAPTEMKSNAKASSPAQDFLLTKLEHSLVWDTIAMWKLFQTSSYVMIIIELVGSKRHRGPFLFSGRKHHV
ncbi:hypothetical protein NHQ30_004887 [Ciborinia camelliae]|nr:hypothetical protein NHQ30_004887 [Ciborinia camelliae]